MASGQCYREVDQTRTTTVTCHKVENGRHHSLTDKVKEMAGKVIHHGAHNQQGNQSARHGSTETCEKKEGFMDKMKHKLKGAGHKKHKEGNCNDSSDSSSDESDDDK